MFRKYQKVARIGTDEVDGILDGTCYIFPKIDGTNASMWTENNATPTGIFLFGSRNRILSLDKDNAGFMKWGLWAENYKEFVHDFPEYRLYGEWLVPHSLKTYRDDAWKRFYIFDVYDGDIPLCYDDYKPLLDDYEIDYIPVQAIIKNPTEYDLFTQIKRNKYLIKDGDGIGEGIVIKNYSFTNKWGRTIWGKVIANEFKEKRTKTFGSAKVDRVPVEQRIVDKYVTGALVEKEYSKIVNESYGWRQEYIPKLLNTVFHCLVTEEAWNFVKGFKNPIIDFRKLNNLCIVKVKEIKPNLF